LPLYRDTNFTWAFVTDERAGRTRLIVRARIAYTPVWPAAIVKALLLHRFGIGDVFQAGRHAQRDTDARRTRSVDSRRPRMKA
jgi:hypothetical protein